MDDTITAPMATGSGQAREAKWEDLATSPPGDDDSSSQSTIGSSTASRAEEKGKAKIPGVDNGEGSSRKASSFPPPKIIVKDATEAEDSLETPSLVAPATTPVQDGTPPRRQATFAALGEALPDQRAVKLPMKRRKLYVRKARYAVLRQPILNAALGRQVGAQAKTALKKLANGELIVVEPPTSL